MKKIIALLLVLAALPFVLISCGEEEQSTSGTYKLSFKVEGVEVYSVETDGRSEVEFPANPTKIGYDFQGWYFMNNDGTRGSKFTADYFIHTPFTSKYDVSVHAYFTPQNSPIPGGDGDVNIPGTNGDTYYDPDGWTKPD
jgi:uncharacterized repeat protein (TIGR02543 family)